MSRFNLALLMVILFIAVFPISGKCQTVPPLPLDSIRPQCMVVMPNAAAPPNWTAQIGNPASLQSCPRSGLPNSEYIQAYFEDVDLSTGQGFDDPTPAGGGITLGQQRRDCVCKVLQYLETVFDFHPDVSPTNPLIVKFGVSSASMFGIAGLSAMTMPNYPLSSPGYHHSYMANAMLNGGPNLGSEFCGNVMVNFYDPLHIQFGYCGSSIAPCEEDFFSVILHEMTHILGMSSGMEKVTSGSSPTINFPLGTNTFTEFDNQFLYYEDPITGSLTKIITGTTPSINSALSVSTLASSYYHVWLTNDPLSTSRLNQPIADNEDLYFIGAMPVNLKL